MTAIIIYDLKALYVNTAVFIFGLRDIFYEGFTFVRMERPVDPGFIFCHNGARKRDKYMIEML